ncbi:MAG: hypothetical protein HY367_01815 [Candidatus Aenigmarchaeota archaeon]|nr:hypothetical protein [Candidatus Aenigmarchaeota archaeon]
MMDNKIMSLLIFVLVFTTMPSVRAHDHPVYFPEAITPEEVSALPLEGQVIWWGWNIHDRIHWIAVVLMFYTCYHFRFWKGRKTHPKGCFKERDPGYSGENRLDAYHRYFWYANVILILIHWSEVLTGLQYGVGYNYVFSYQVPGIIFEVFYVVAFSLWLFSCHFFRFFGGGGCTACGGFKRAYSGISVLNARHGIFMWLALLSFVLLLLVQGHL